MKSGRPTKYHPKYCQELIAHFDIEPYTEEERTVASKRGITIQKVKIPNPLPTLANFAKTIGVHRDTLNQWSREHPEFSDAIKRAKDCQEHILITNGLFGFYEQPFAVFTAKNVLGWKDKQETELGGTLNIVIDEALKRKE